MYKGAQDKQDNAHLQSSRLALLAERVDEGTGGDKVLTAAICAELNLIPTAFLTSMDAALALLPEKMAWRRLTGEGCSVYASSPRAKMQVRHDGYSPEPARGIVAGFLRYHERLAKGRERARA